MCVEVVFHVNTRNDDNDLFHEAMREAHEQEIAQVVKAANDKLQKASEAVEKAKSRQVLSSSRASSDVCWGGSVCLFSKEMNTLP